MFEAGAGQVPSRRCSTVICLTPGVYKVRLKVAGGTPYGEGEGGEGGGVPPPTIAEGGSGGLS